MYFTKDNKTSLSEIKMYCLTWHHGTQTGLDVILWLLYFNDNSSGHLKVEYYCLPYICKYSPFESSSLTWKVRDHLSLGRRLDNRHLQPAFPSCLNHCAWPRARPEPVPPLLVLGFALMLSVTMRGSFSKSLTFSIFAVGNDIGPGLRVCYSFKQFLWRFFFFFLNIL